MDEIVALATGVRMISRQEICYGSINYDYYLQTGYFDNEITTVNTLQSRGIPFPGTVIQL